MRYNPRRTPEQRWASDNLQFMRLLAEINAWGLTHEQGVGIAESMDLRLSQVNQLLNRATEAWDKYVATIPKAVSR